MSDTQEGGAPSGARSRAEDPARAEALPEDVGPLAATAADGRDGLEQFDRVVENRRRNTRIALLLIGVGLGLFLLSQVDFARLGDWF